jgi:hypothetical protein
LVQLQHLTTDEDRFVNNLLEEAAEYREKPNKKGPE